LAVCGVNGYIVMVTMWHPDLAGREGPRYLAIVDALAEDVASEALSSGSRLPTHRELAERLGVTVGTVSRAYGEAARRGLVSGEIGRGTFVRSGARAEEDPQEGAGTIDLAENHPPEPATRPQRAALAASLAALPGRADFGRLLTYPAAGGNPEDREAGAEWIGRAGVKAAADRVLVCTGSQHGLTVVLATLLQPGDLLLTEALTYAGLKSVAGLLHLKVAGLPVDAHGLRPDALEAACRSGAARALYVIPTLHNPTTAVMPLERRREIVEIAERHGLAVVEDDVHGLLPEKRPVPLAALVPDRSYYLTSTSKTLAPGLRIAYVLAPPAMVPRLTDSLRATTWAVAPLTAAIASSWIESGTADAILAETPPGRRLRRAARGVLLVAAAARALAARRLRRGPSREGCRGHVGRRVRRRARPGAPRRASVLGRAPHPGRASTRPGSRRGRASGGRRGRSGRRLEAGCRTDFISRCGPARRRPPWSI
jgi:DNA-binding transcriptional MocR family regulator